MSKSSSWLRKLLVGLVCVNCCILIIVCAIAAIYAQAAGDIRCMDILSIYTAEADPASLYYRTDHHWTSYGAYKAYAAYIAHAGKGKLLVIRDSYANCIGPMLAESYEEVIMVDLRYYKLPISDLCQTEGVSNVLVMYSLSNFMTDANFPFLR